MCLSFVCVYSGYMSSADLHIFSLSLWLVFNSLNGVFWEARIFNFDEAQSIRFFMRGSAGVYLRSQWLAHGHRDFLLCLLLVVLVLQLVILPILSVLIHELGISLHLLWSSYIAVSNGFQFSVQKTCSYFINFFLSILFFWKLL